MTKLVKVVWACTKKAIGSMMSTQALVELSLEN